MFVAGEEGAGLIGSGSGVGEREGERIFIGGLTVRCNGVVVKSARGESDLARMGNFLRSLRDYC